MVKKFFYDMGRCSSTVNPDEPEAGIIKDVRKWIREKNVRMFCYQDFPL